MRVIPAICAVILSIMLVPGFVYGQTLKEGTLTGEIRSASATVPPGTSGSVLLVPDNRFYVLTQVCLDDIFSIGTLAGSDIGIVVTGTECTAYAPGIVFQPGEELTFTVDPSPFPVPDDARSVTVTGILIDPNQEGD